MDIHSSGLDSNLNHGMLSIRKFGNFRISYLTIHDRSSIMVSMNKLTTDKRVSVVKHLVDGCSITGRCE